MTPDEREAADNRDEDEPRHRTADRAYTEYDTSGMIQASRSGMRMTKDQVTAFYEEYQALVWKYVTPAGGIPKARGEWPCAW
jgi:hypothetical protein